MSKLKVNVGDVCVDIEWTLKSASGKSYVYVYSDSYDGFDRFAIIGDAVATCLSALSELGVKSSEVTISVGCVWQQTSSGRIIL